MKKLFFSAILATGFAVGAMSSAITPARADIGIGQKVAEFSLPDANGKSVSVGDFDKAKATVVMFIATRCPISLDYDTRMKALGDAYKAKGVRFFGINSNRQEPVAEMGEHASEKGFTFPVLKDAGNKIADVFGAQTTPEVYVIGSGGTLLYKGQIDNSRDQANVKSKPLANALDAILEGKAVTESETRAHGCTIKREK